MIKGLGIGGGVVGEGAPVSLGDSFREIAKEGEMERRMGIGEVFEADDGILAVRDSSHKEVQKTIGEDVSIGK